MTFNRVLPTLQETQRVPKNCQKPQKNTVSGGVVPQNWSHDEKLKFLLLSYSGFGKETLGIRSVFVPGFRTVFGRFWSVVDGFWKGVRKVVILRAHARTSLAAFATWHTPKMLDALTITLAHCAVHVMCTTPHPVPNDGGEDLHVWPHFHVVLTRTRLRKLLLDALTACLKRASDFQLVQEDPALDAPRDGPHLAIDALIRLVCPESRRQLPQLVKDACALLLIGHSLFWFGACGPPLHVASGS